MQDASAASRQLSARALCAASLMVSAPALEAKLVAYDYSLDGNLFRSSHGLKRRALVVQAALGLSVHAVIVGHGVRLALMRVTRSHEFARQDGTHSFGSVALSVDF